MMISTLSSFDEMYSRMEALFRYSGWNIKLFKTPEGEIVYGFYPQDDKPYKTHVAARLRKRNKIQIESANEFFKEVETTQKEQNRNAEAGARGRLSPFLQKKEYFLYFNRKQIVSFKKDKL